MDIGTGADQELHDVGVPGKHANIKGGFPLTVVTLTFTPD